MLFIWFSHTSENNSIRPLVIGLIPVSGFMMLIPLKVFVMVLIIVVVDLCVW